MSTLDADAILWPGGELAPGTIDFDERTGLITATSRRDGIPGPGVSIIAPGFVDLQCNGWDGDDVATADLPAWQRLERHVLSHGVTTWCPTLISAPLDTYPAVLARIDGWSSDPSEAAATAEATATSDDRHPRPAVVGMHLEGPFLGEVAGAHDPAAVRAIDLDWLRALPDCVAVMTLGPEQPDALAAAAELRARGVLAALGHSNATFDRTVAVIDAGARLGTHVFNAMAPLHHRRPGIVGAALSDPRFAVSVIADGVHLHPAVLRTVFAAKGGGRVALVTDSVAWRHHGYAVGDGAARLPDGTLAGSVLTMDRALRVVTASGVAPQLALQAASETPAALLGLTDRGRIAPGARADLITLSADLEIERVWVGGRPLP